MKLTGQMEEGFRVLAHELLVLLFGKANFVFEIACVQGVRQGAFAVDWVVRAEEDAVFPDFIDDLFRRGHVDPGGIAINVRMLFHDLDREFVVAAKLEVRGDEADLGESPRDVREVFDRRIDVHRGMDQDGQSLFFGEAIIIIHPRIVDLDLRRIGMEFQAVDVAMMRMDIFPEFWRNLLIVGADPEIAADARRVRALESQEFFVNRHGIKTPRGFIPDAWEFCRVAMGHKREPDPMVFHGGENGFFRVVKGWPRSDVAVDINRFHQDFPVAFIVSP